MMTGVGHVLIVIGALFSLLGALGILRMPDIYNRLQAGTKATTLGAFSLILGVGLANPNFLGKGILLILFIMLTNPLSSSVIARSGRRSGIALVKGSVVDEYAAVLEREKPETDALENDEKKTAVSPGEGEAPEKDEKKGETV